MTTQLFAAVDVPLVTPIVVAVVTGFSTWFVQRWRFRHEASNQATRVLRQYRDPLLRAAYDLQSRIYNIVAKEYLDRYWRKGNTNEKANAIYGTLWFFGQYLGWTEILRREIQYLDVGSRLENQQVQGCLNEISAEMSADSGPRGDKLKIIRSDQRAVGDFMITTRATAGEGPRPDCRGYSEFIQALPSEQDDQAMGADDRYSPVSAWHTGFTADLQKAGEGSVNDLPARLVNLQRLLVNLVDLLDPDRSRFPHLDFRGKLPRPEGSATPKRDQVAQFVWPWSDPWPTVEAWARKQRLGSIHKGGNKRIYRGPPGPTRRRPEFTVTHLKGQVVIQACSRRGKNHAVINGSLRLTRARSMTNDLLERFDRPPISGVETTPARLGSSAVGLIRRMQGGPAGGLAP